VIGRAAGPGRPEVRRVNRPGAELCYLCGDPLVTGPGANAFVGDASAPGEARPRLRPIPMLLFTEARGTTSGCPPSSSSSSSPSSSSSDRDRGGATGPADGDRPLLRSVRDPRTTAYFSGSSIVLSIHGAREAGGEEHRQLRNVVEEMAIAAGVPPRRYT